MRTLVDAYSLTRCLSKYTPFDSVREQAVNTCTQESFILVQCLLYFSPEIMTDLNVFVFFQTEVVALSHNPLTQAIVNVSICCCCCSFLGLVVFLSL